MLEKFSPWDVVHDEVDPVCFLKDIVHAYEERVIDLEKNELFSQYVFLSIVLKDHIFPDALHRVVLVRLLAVDTIYFPESAPTDLTDHFEIIEGGSVCSPTSEKQRRCLVSISLFFLVPKVAVKWLPLPGCVGLVHEHLLDIVECRPLRDVPVRDALVEVLHEPLRF